MANYLKLTLSTGEPAIVNMDVVSLIRREGQRTRLYFLSGDENDKIDVAESLEDIESLLAKKNA